MSQALSKTGERMLARCEETIERGLATFMEVGSALLEIRDGRLYRSEYSDFETYCQRRWSMSKRRANQLVEAVQVGTIVPVSNEAQARALAPVADDPDAVKEVYEAAAEEGPVTAASLTEQVNKRRTAGGSNQAKEGGADAPGREATDPPAVPEPGMTDAEAEHMEAVLSSDAGVAAARTRSNLTALFKAAVFTLTVDPEDAANSTETRSADWNASTAAVLAAWLDQYRKALSPLSIVQGGKS